MSFDNAEPELLCEAARHAASRRTTVEARVCSQPDCPGDGRYQPPGRGHRDDCQHNAVRWVWETVRPLADRSSTPVPTADTETTP